MSKKRALIILKIYPQISETYMATEMEALGNRYEIDIISLRQPNLRYRYHRPYHYRDDWTPDRMAEMAQEFGTDVLHSHYIFHANLLHRIARAADIPFTIRTHSFDVLGPNIPKIEKYASTINSEYCLGILAFPFTRPQLERAGIDRGKIHDCWPVVDVDRFLDTAPNGDGVMNNGACMPKKNMETYLKLAEMMPGKTFDLYALGYVVKNIQAANARLGNPANIIPPVEPRDMPREYKKHEWLVYTASPEINTVGWPLSVPEAQASGVGVCIQNIRPDLAEFVGEAGYLVDTMEDAAKIISQPFSNELREMGFAQAKKSDVNGHIGKLEALWAGV